MILLAVWAFFLVRTIFLQMVGIFLALSSICWMSFAAFQGGVHIYAIQSTVRMWGDVILPFQSSSLGVIRLLNVKMYVYVCILSPPLLMAILLLFVTSCFLGIVFLSSRITKDHSLFFVYYFWCIKLCMRASFTF